MDKNVTIKIPKWLSEDEANKLINEFLAKLSGVVSINEFRKEFGIKLEDLVEDLELFDVEELEKKEKRRLNQK